MITISVNGKPLEIDQDATVLALIESKGLIPEAVVIERNGSILDRAQWAQTPLLRNDSIEIVHFVGGG